MNTDEESTAARRVRQAMKPKSRFCNSAPWRPLRSWRSLRSMHFRYSPAAVALCLLLSSVALADDVTAGGGEPFALRDDPASTQPNVEGGLVEYLADRFSPHEPIYFIWGPDDPQVKFQVSLKYQVFTPDGNLAKAVPWV